MSSFQQLRYGTIRVHQSLGLDLLLRYIVDLQRGFRDDLNASHAAADHSEVA